ncbi:MarR family transcriptional regulator [Nocardia yunnanensis]|uniref:MarR family transcriptional regulator n=1 Tax=Nocardia yunnanensis TaxID=2382165 RepID=A0A386ZFA3_9NOCA|nr:MarR family winged helix-turn-helix transcriptional regulator [Nocardia yunnanensis]AYF75893.1 MarR family transcriptional regulator [Nocardia yunnanensis]
MTDRPANTPPSGTERSDLETEIARDIRALGAVSEQIGHVFARAHGLRPNDFRALAHVATAESEGASLTAGRLGALTGVSPAAITYLVERMIESGHLERVIDSADRRRVKLHYTDHGMAVAAGFFRPLSARMRSALSPLSDAELETTHRAMVSIIGALREFATELDEGGEAGPETPRGDRDSRSPRE